MGIASFFALSQRLKVLERAVPGYIARVEMITCQILSNLHLDFLRALRNYHWLSYSGPFLVSSIYMQLFEDGVISLDGNQIPFIFPAFQGRSVALTEHQP
jgi:hypothetical protein